VVLGPLCPNPFGGTLPGQPHPGREAAPFTEGLLNTGHATRDPALLPDGSELYVGLFLPGFHKALILETYLDGGRWTAPRVALFSSDRPTDPKAEKPGPLGLWVMVWVGRGGPKPAA